MKRLFMLLALCLPAPLSAAPCRLALVLSMDVSRSVDEHDYVIMTEGLIAALLDPDVQTAFFAPAGDVAISVYQWSGWGHQELLADWSMIHAPDDLAPVVAAIHAAHQPEHRQLTALGAGLDFGRSLIERAPDCARRVIDVAGDGRNNEGPSPKRIYANGGWDNITVNGLAISEHEIGLVDYFNQDLIRGPGAFVEVADTQDKFPPAIRRKLLRELVDAVAALGPATGGKS